jgi:hypothetical protein
VRGFLWTDLSHEVIAEFEELGGVLQSPPLPTTQSLAEYLTDIDLTRENDAVLEKVPDITRAFLSRRWTTRRGIPQTTVKVSVTVTPLSKQCSRCTRPKVLDRAQCEYHLDIARRAMRKKHMQEQIEKREKLEVTREGLTQHFTILTRVPAQYEGEPDSVKEVDGYVTTGLYPDGRLGEIFICVAKEDAAMGPMLDAWAKSCSMALQYGVPVSTLLGKEVGTRFSPAGPVTGVAGITKCTSPTDLISRWLIAKYSPVTVIVDEPGGET